LYKKVISRLASYQMGLENLGILCLRLAGPNYLKVAVTTKRDSEEKSFRQRKSTKDP